MERRAADALRYASYGYTGFFDELRIGDAELERLYAYDQALLAGVKTLGDLILGQATYGEEGVIAGAIVVALLALTFELILAAVQRTLTPRGLALQRAAARASA